MMTKTQVLKAVKDEMAKYGKDGRLRVLPLDPIFETLKTVEARLSWMLPAGYRVSCLQNGEIDVMEMNTFFASRKDKLVASAPALLAALKMFVKEYEGGPERELRPEMIAAREAIAGAE